MRLLIGVLSTGGGGERGGGGVVLHTVPRYVPDLIIVCSTIMCRTQAHAIACTCPLARAVDVVRSCLKSSLLFRFAAHLGRQAGTSWAVTLVLWYLGWSQSHSLAPDWSFVCVSGPCHAAAPPNPRFLPFSSFSLLPFCPFALLLFCSFAFLTYFYFSQSHARHGHGHVHVHVHVSLTCCPTLPCLPALFRPYFSSYTSSCTSSYTSSYTSSSLSLLLPLLQSSPRVFEQRSGRFPPLPFSPITWPFNHQTAPSWPT